MCVCIMNFMVVDLSCDIFNWGTHAFVYALVHVMCVCEYGMLVMYVV
jgi:hypothetical protein